MENRQWIRSRRPKVRPLKQRRKMGERGYVIPIPSSRDSRQPNTLIPIRGCTTDMSSVYLAVSLRVYTSVDGGQKERREINKYICPIDQWDILLSFFTFATSKLSPLPRLSDIHAFVKKRFYLDFIIITVVHIYIHVDRYSIPEISI